MTKEEHIKYWVTSAEHDFDAMHGIFNAGKYDWALFVGHLVLEKILKAHWVKNNQSDTPPKIHNLAKLYKESSLSILNEDEVTFLIEATRFNMEGRYPQAKFAFFKLCTREFTESKIEKIQEIYHCLLKAI